MPSPTAARGFPLPSSLKVVPGTEGAQAAYPYYMQFAPEDDTRFWFYNSMHFPEPMSAFDMVTAEAAYCALGAVEHARALPADHARHRPPDHQRPRLHRRQRRDRSGRDRASAPRSSSSARSTTTRTGSGSTRSGSEKMMALIDDAQALPKLDAAGVRAARERARRPRRRLQPLPARHLPEDARRLLPDVAPPLRVPAARVRRVLTFFGFCKKAFPEITRPDRSRAWSPAWKRRSSGPDEEAAAPRAPRGRARRRCASSSDGPRRRRRARRRSSRSGDAGRELARGARDSRATRGSTSTSATASITITAAWNDDLSMPFAALPGLHREGARPANRSSGRSSSCSDERSQLIADYRELLDTDEERAAYDQMIDARAPRVPVRRGAQVLLRALVHEPVLQQDPRVRRAAGASTASSPTTEDVFQLTHYELEERDHRPDDVAGRTARRRAGPQHWPAIVAERARGHRGVGEARDAARARAGAGRDRRSGHRDALGHHAREPRCVADGGQRARSQRAHAASPPRAAWSKDRRAW